MEGTLLPDSFNGTKFGKNHKGSTIFYLNYQKTAKNYQKCQNSTKKALLKVAFGEINVYPKLSRLGVCALVPTQSCIWSETEEFFHLYYCLATALTLYI